MTKRSKRHQTKIEACYNINGLPKEQLYMSSSCHACHYQRGPFRWFRVSSVKNVS
jgi:hypothetical protein